MSSFSPKFQKFFDKFDLCLKFTFHAKKNYRILKDCTSWKGEIKKKKKKKKKVKCLSATCYLTVLTVLIFTDRWQEPFVALYIVLGRQTHHATFIFMYQG